MSRETEIVDRVTKHLNQGIPRERSQWLSGQRQEQNVFKGRRYVTQTVRKDWEKRTEVTVVWEDHEKVLWVLRKRQEDNLGRGSRQYLYSFTGPEIKTCQDYDTDVRKGSTGVRLGTVFSERYPTTNSTNTKICTGNSAWEQSDG